MLADDHATQGVVPQSGKGAGGEQGAVERGEAWGRERERESSLKSDCVCAHDGRRAGRRS